MRNAANIWQINEKTPTLSVILTIKSAGLAWARQTFLKIQLGSDIDIRFDFLLRRHYMLFFIPVLIGLCSYKNELTIWGHSRWKFTFTQIVSLRAFLLFGKDLFPYLKVPLDVRCLGMKWNHWNIICAELPTIYDSECFLLLLCTNFISTSCVFWVKSKHLA